MTQFFFPFFKKKKFWKKKFFFPKIDAMVQFVTCSLVVLHRVSGEKVLWGVSNLSVPFFLGDFEGKAPMVALGMLFFQKIKRTKSIQKKSFFSLVW